MGNEYFSMQIDERLRSDFEHFCTGCGLTISESVNLLAKQTIRKQAIPFEIASLSTYADSVGRRPKDGAKSGRLTIRMDRELQNGFAAACDAIGLSRSALVRMFFIRCLREQKISFI